MTSLIELQGVSRRFMSGEQEVTVLHPLDLTIDAGEMVAIVGASGSGKSTLMNLLGCLDHPSEGRYLFRGQDTAALDTLAQARLRSEHFGFIFQRYHLLPHLDACANVEVPAIYAGHARQERHQRARELLLRLGLDQREHHTPNQLSGGQQQRVSIARALVNGAEVILADEPTGALDSQSGQEVLAILKELHQLGHTIILVTHDPEIAAHAERIIELKDGRVIRDQGRVTRPAVSPRSPQAHQANLWERMDRLREAFQMAWHAMKAHRMRTFLTMLGIIIGIAAVVSVVALGQGARQKVISDISAMGTNTVDIFPGKGWGDEKASTIHTLNEGDLQALTGQPYLAGATPSVSSSAQVRWRNRSLSGSLTGVSPAFFEVKGLTLQQGRLLNDEDLRSRSAVAVIDATSMTSLFGSQNPIGQVVFAGSVPVRIVGVAEQKSRWGGGQGVSLWLPYSALMSRILVQDHFDQITVRLAPNIDAAIAARGVTSLLEQRHGTQDFFTQSNDMFLQSVEKTTGTMTLLVSSIAVISLIVGGVGVMNIMLVSVVERTREIGIRVAVGARRSDIMQQFLIEAVMVTLVGGVIGVLLSLLIGAVFGMLVESMQMHFSLFSLVMAFGCSSLIGILFGYLPARNAARLDPVEALARE